MKQVVQLARARRKPALDIRNETGVSVIESILLLFWIQKVKI